MADALGGEVRVNVRPSRAMSREIRTQLRSSGPSGPIGDWFRQAEARYGSQAVREFKASSRGGGDWPPLKPATISKRRMRGGGTIGSARMSKSTRRRQRAARAAGKAAILVDTGTLQKAVDPQGAGHKSVQRPGTLIYRFADSQHSARGPTIQQLANWHHSGAGNLPKREILRQPSDQTRRGMRADMDRAIGEIGRAMERRHWEGT